MGNLFHDLRYALRQLRQSPGFTLTAVLTLAFGIGASTAIFSIVEGVLLRPLPFPDAAHLVTLGDRLEGVEYGTEAPGVTPPGVQIYLRDTHGFTALGGFTTANYELSGFGEPVQINAARMTASMFPTLRVSPMMGRVFTQQEDDGRAQLAVISYAMWRSRFNSDPGALGRKIQLDRKAYEIIGVMPREFEFPLVPGQLNRSELWVPISLTQAELVQGSGNWGYYLVGRLKTGVTAAMAEQDAVGAAAEIMRNFPPALASRKIHPVVQSLDETTIAAARPMVRTLFFAALVVLLIGCANLAGLLLTRLIRRRRAIAVRLALGASGAAVLRHSLLESLLLSVSGGLLGLALAAGALPTAVKLLPETLPRVSSIGLDWMVVGFALALAVLTGVLCGVIPAVAATRISVHDALKEGGRTGSASGYAGLRSALVVGELAIALVLLASSGLLLRSFEKMRAVDLGFKSDHTLTASYALPKQQYTTQAAIDAFNTNLHSRLEALPGVKAVGVTTMLPANDVEFRGTFTAEGYVPPKGAGLNLAWIPLVSGNYFQAQCIPIVRGRAFLDSDNANSPLVAIVNQKLAEHYWPGQDPIGKQLHRGPERATTLPWATVVGEIGEVKELSPESPTMNQIYLPASQAKADAGSFAPPGMLMETSGTVVVRGEMAPEAMESSLRAVVRGLDPQLPLTQVEPMDRVVAEGQAPRRFNTALISGFAAAAVLLALLGVYAVISFSTALRTQEMAIRLALGAGRTSVMRLILTSAAWLGLTGCGLGVGAAVLVARLLRSLLFGVDPLDPVVLVLATVSLFLLAVAASVIPARRASKVDPMLALRAE